MKLKNNINYIVYMKPERLSYLKPLVYDNLFDEKKNNSNNYEDILNKLTCARISFFNFQAGILNFIKDCEILKNKIRCDSLESDLNTIKFDYILLLNNLIAHSAISLRKRSEDQSVLINYEVPRTQYNKTIKDFENLEPTCITLYDATNKVETLITRIPSISLYLKKNFQLEMKIIFPNTTSYSCITNDKLFARTYNAYTSDCIIYKLTPELTRLKISDKMDFTNSSITEVFSNSNVKSSDNNEPKTDSINTDSNTISNSKSETNDVISIKKNTNSDTDSEENLSSLFSLNSDSKNSSNIKKYKNNDLTKLLKNTKYGFVNNINADTFLDDIINYDNNHLKYEHQLRESINLIDGIITYIENTYRIIIQKLRTDNLAIDGEH